MWQGILASRQSRAQLEGDSSAVTIPENLPAPLHRYTYTAEWSSSDELILTIHPRNRAAGRWREGQNRLSPPGPLPAHLPPGPGTAAPYSTAAPALPHPGPRRGPVGLWRTAPCSGICTANWGGARTHRPGFSSTWKSAIKRSGAAFWALLSAPACKELTDGYRPLQDYAPEVAQACQIVLDALGRLAPHPALPAPARGLDPGQRTRIESGPHHGPLCRIGRRARLLYHPFHRSGRGGRSDSRISGSRAMKTLWRPLLWVFFADRPGAGLRRRGGLLVCPRPGGRAAATARGSAGIGRATRHRDLRRLGRAHLHLQPEPPVGRPRPDRAARRPGPHRHRRRRFSTAIGASASKPSSVRGGPICCTGWAVGAAVL